MAGSSILVASTKYNFTKTTHYREFAVNAWFLLYARTYLFSILSIIFPYFVHSFRVCPHILSTRSDLRIYVNMYKCNIIYLCKYTNVYLYGIFLRKTIDKCAVMVYNIIKIRRRAKAHKLNGGNGCEKAGYEKSMGNIQNPYW